MIRLGDFFWGGVEHFLAKIGQSLKRLAHYFWPKFVDLIKLLSISSVPYPAILLLRLALRAGNPVVPILREWGVKVTLGPFRPKVADFLFETSSHTAP